MKEEYVEEGGGSAFRSSGHQEGRPRPERSGKQAAGLRDLGIDVGLFGHGQLSETRDRIRSAIFPPTASHVNSFSTIVLPALPMTRARS